MKKIIILSTLTLMFNSKLFSQNNIYIVTEKYNSPLGFDKGYTQMDSLFVTTPAGITTAYGLPHYLSSTGEHDKQLSAIINAITSLGYKNISNNDWSGIPVYAYNRTAYSKPDGAIKTLIFAQPWTTTSSGLEEAKPSQISMKIYPNPTIGPFSIEVQYLDGYEPKEVMVINQLGYIVYKKQINYTQGVVFNLDLSNMSSGTYLVRLLNSSFYSKSANVIIQH